MLLNRRGDLLTDKRGQQIKRNATVTHEIFGDGIARGTVPIVGEGVNVLIDWLGPGASEKPKRAAGLSTSPSNSEYGGSSSTVGKSLRLEPQVVSVAAPISRGFR